MLSTERTQTGKSVGRNAVSIETRPGAEHKTAMSQGGGEVNRGDGGDDVGNALGQLALTKQLLSGFKAATEITVSTQRLDIVNKSGRPSSGETLRRRQ